MVIDSFSFLCKNPLYELPKVYLCTFELLNVPSRVAPYPINPKLQAGMQITAALSHYKGESSCKKRETNLVAESYHQNQTVRVCTSLYCTVKLE